MIYGQDLARSYGEKLGRLCNAYEKPMADASIVCNEQPATHVMKIMVAYRWGEQALCKYLRQEQEQQAFNLVAGCFEPLTMPWDLKPGGAFFVTILPSSMDDKSDPLGQAGYIGIKRKKQSPNN